MEKTGDRKTKTFWKSGRDTPHWGEAGNLRPDYLNLKSLEKRFVVNDRYQIEKIIGEGGFGIVFEAVDITLNAKVALKFLNPVLTEDEQKFIRVKREITISRKITDERIVQIFDLGKWQDLHFLVMELVEGKTLKSYLSEKEKSEWSEFKNIFFEILEAVGILHHNQIIHRDLKPSNIIVTKKNKIKLLDFGLAKEITDWEKTSSADDIVGSLAYISPEQLDGKNIHFRSDIYQLGIILYQSLSGKLPFSDENASTESVFKRLKERPKKIPEDINVPEFVKFAVEKSLERKPRGRFKSIKEMLHFLKEEEISWKKRVFFKLITRPSRFIMIFLFAAALVALGYKFFVKESTPHQVENEGSRLSAWNRYGFKIWEREFSPFIVFDGIMTGDFIPNLSNEKGIFTILLHHPYPQLPPDASINSREYDNWLALLDSRGQPLLKYPFSTAFRIQTYDFPGLFLIDTYEKKDIDDDGSREAIIGLTQANGMYPSALVLFKGSEIYTFSNPGYLMEYRVVQSDKRACKILVLGQNYPVSGLSFLAELHFNRNNRINGIPNLSPYPIFNMSGFLYFLPSNCKILKDSWREKGEIAFVNSISKEKLFLNRNFHLTVKSGKGESLFKDNRENLKRVYRLINQCFQAKMKRRNIPEAYEYIKKALDLGVENPYLKSALLYFKGDLEVASGEYQQGAHTLRQALHLYPYNMHAIRLIAEIKFLNGQPMEALQAIDKMTANLILPDEEKEKHYLFKAYCHLQAGNFAEAEALLAGSERYHGIIEVFKGNYQDAFKLLEAIEEEQGPKKPFDIAAYRLLFSRASLLSGKGLERAKFYFKDLFDFSLRFRHLAAVSMSYFLAKESQQIKARQMAQHAFKELLQISKGDFEARFWLFYDGYIYGKTMEILGDKEEALRGFKVCITANPYTELAKKSRLKLNKPFKEESL
jgi:serine/threonine protein kinase